LRRRQGDALICVVRWAHPESAARSFLLAELSLTASVVCWQYYANSAAAQAEMQQGSAMPASSGGAAQERLDKREHLSPITAVAGSNFVGRSSRAVPASL